MLAGLSRPVYTLKVFDCRVNAGTNLHNYVIPPVVVTPDGVAALTELLVTDLAGRWELFVGQLGVSQGVRDQIKHDNADKPQASKHCFQSGLYCWVNSDDLPTYSKVSSVLRGRTVTNKSLARKVEQLGGCSQGELQLLYYLRILVRACVVILFM